MALFLSLAVGLEPARADEACSYQQMATIPSGNRTAHVLAVDLNKDGIPDIVGANHGGMALTKGTISVVLNTGKGSFAPVVSYTLGNAGPYETTAADFNADGYLDLAVELFGTSGPTIIGTEVDVFINRGDGTFHPFVACETGNKPRAVATTDLNRDGRQDLIVANSTVNTVGVLPGNGDGTFGARSDYPAGHNPHGVAAADFNMDGKPDVAVCNHGPSGAVNVLMGRGDGTLAETVQFEAGNGTFSLDAGDLDGDGDTDIVTANNYAASVSVLINTGTGEFEKPVYYPISEGQNGAPVAVTLGDLQGDGNLDVLCSICNIRDETAGGITNVFFGNGDGTLAPAVPVETGNGSYDTAVADFDGDGVMDIVSAVSTGSLVIMKGTCDSE